MKNFYQTGQVIPFTAGADVTSGQIVKVGTLVGVATGDVASGATGQVAIAGVYTLPKASATVFTAGAPAYVSGTATVVTATATGADYAGRAIAPAASGTTSVRVLLASYGNAGA